MTLHEYKSKKFNARDCERIDECNTIIEQYQEQNLRLTLRQLYYQLVSKNVISNEEKSYKALGKLVSDARLAGLMSWDAIEDRIRRPQRAAEWSSIADLADAASHAFRLERWQGQDNYVELWVEKDALAGVLAPIANEYHVTLMVNRGYSSTSAMYESAKRFKSREFTTLPKLMGYTHPPKTRVVDSRRLPEFKRKLHLLYLGDHDPSGEDMVRDVRDRLWQFNADVRVEKVALTMAQIEKYDPPPNPAKITDSRAAHYIDLYGDSSWEVDAIPPEELAVIIRRALDKLVDQELVNAIKAKEEHDKKRLREAVAKL